MINARYIASTFIVLLASTLAFAGEGDKDKDKKNGSSNNATVKDSIVIKDIKLDVIDQDDTLVFEDWDRPGDEDWGNGDGQSSDLGKVTGASGTGDKLNNLTDQGAVELANAFKRDYKVDFTVFPNPTANELHIKPTIEPASLRIMDIAGREHKSMNYVPVVQVTDLPQGIYFIQLVYNDHLETRKFIRK